MSTEPLVSLCVFAIMVSPNSFENQTQNFVVCSLIFCDICCYCDMAKLVYSDDGKIINKSNNKNNTSLRYYLIPQIILLLIIVLHC